MNTNANPIQFGATNSVPTGTTSSASRVASTATNSGANSATPGSTGPNPNQNRTDAEPNADQKRPTSDPKADEVRTKSWPKPTDTGDAPESPRAYAERMMQDIKNRIAREREMEADLEREEAKLVLRARSPIDLLPPARQRLLYQVLCDYSARIVEEVVTLPEPDGWDLDTTDSSLKRFKERYERRLHSDRQKEIDDLAREILSNPLATENELDLATQRLFKARLLDAINDPKESPKNIRDYFQAYTRLRALELAERKQQNE